MHLINHAKRPKTVARLLRQIREGFPTFDEPMIVGHSLGYCDAPDCDVDTVEDVWVQIKVDSIERAVLVLFVNWECSHVFPRNVVREDRCPGCQRLLWPVDLVVREPITAHMSVRELEEQAREEALRQLGQDQEHEEPVHAPIKREAIAEDLTTRWQNSPPFATNPNPVIKRTRFGNRK